LFVVGGEGREGERKEGEIAGKVALYWVFWTKGASGKVKVSTHAWQIV